MIKCVMLNAHCTLISEIVEVDAELGNPNCKLSNHTFTIA